MPDAVDRKETGSDRSGTSAGNPPRGAPSLAILGADALLAAQPSTAVQLAHACLRMGFQTVVPASWGDELIAGACVRHLAARHGNGNAGPAIFCACPHVAHRLLAVGSDLEPFLASFVAPPVALARYLRTVYAPTRIRLTYVGRCPGAADETIDARVSPDELLAVLGERGIVLADQPRAFDSVIPPDRRRYLSQPGGLPSTDVLRRAAPDVRVVELTDPDLAIELTQHLLSKAQMLIDAGPRLGCACSGAVGPLPPEDARRAATALEPPRASSPVVDDRVPVPLDLALPAVARTPIEVAGSGQRAADGAPDGVPDGVPDADGTSDAGRGARQLDQSSAAMVPTSDFGLHPPTPPGGRRRSPTHGVPVRQHSGAVPTTRSGEGRALPRAYVARRGSTPRGRGPNTPPRGEAAQRLDASGGSGGANGGGLRGGGAPSSPERVERVERVEHGERLERVERVGHGETPVSGAAATLAARSAGMALGATELRAVANPIGAPPDHASDPHGHGQAEAFRVPDDVVEEAMRAAAELRAPTPAPASAPISEVTVPRSSFRTRSTELARLAVSAAHRRRVMIGLLLGVALVSATVGVVAGRWLAAEARTPAGDTK